MSVTRPEKNYKFIFFDLDHTLWDYEKNAEETLADLYTSYKLHERGVPDAQSLYHRFRSVNIALWDLYDRNLVDQAYIRTERFKQILDHFGAYEKDLSDKVSSDYLDSCPKKQNLIPHANDILEYLSRKYHLTVVTNGFEEIQNIKLTSGDLHRYFKHIVTSQKAGHKKPSQKIFEFAMTLNNAACCDVVMIGDNLITDIGGARGASIDTIFFNRDKISHEARVDYEINCLSELTNIL
jgi:YjjG family noncanonical pyrimidine nucleotidase